jgi:uncharacterized membrane protein YgdD (TMEM256/DUF423 family)
MAILLGISIGIGVFIILYLAIRLSSRFKNQVNHEKFLLVTAFALMPITIWAIGKTSDLIATLISFIVTIFFFQGLILFSMVRKKKLTGKVHPEK